MLENQPKDNKMDAIRTDSKKNQVKTHKNNGGKYPAVGGGHRRMRE